MATPIEAKIFCIQEATKRNFPINGQSPEWLKIGVEKLKEGKLITENEIDQIDRQNSQLDPTLK